MDSFDCFINSLYKEQEDFFNFDDKIGISETFQFGYEEKGSPVDDLVDDNTIQEPQQKNDDHDEKDHENFLIDSIFRQNQFSDSSQQKSIKESSSNNIEKLNVSEINEYYLYLNENKSEILNTHLEQNNNEREEESCQESDEFVEKQEEEEEEEQNIRNNLKKNLSGTRKNYLLKNKSQLPSNWFKPILRSISNSIVSQQLEKILAKFIRTNEVKAYDLIPIIELFSKKEFYSLFSIKSLSKYLKAKYDLKFRVIWKDFFYFYLQSKFIKKWISEHPKFSHIQFVLKEIQEKFHDMDIGLLDV